jgi:hypothetical protein
MKGDERFLEWKQSRDPELFQFYENSLFEPGWAGQLSDGQARYIRDVLIGNVRCKNVRSVRRLRRAWGMRPRQDYISDDAVREVAMYGRPDDFAYNTHLVEKYMLIDLLQLIVGNNNH